MKLRTQLMIVNGISFGFIFLFLMMSYMQMTFFTQKAILILLAVTMGAGVISFFTHYFLIRPIQRAIQLIVLESKKVAAGNFEGKVPEIGPVEFKNLAEHFNDMNRHLEESFAKLHKEESARKELVANVSHDLRTPLTSIQSFVEALQDDIIKDEKTFRTYLNTIRLETKRVSLLVEDLFELSQLETREETFSPVPYHMDNLILETLQNQYLQLEAKNIEVSVNIPEQTPAVVIVPEKIQRVIINLIQNAIRHSSQGDGIEIQVSEFSREWIKVTVLDQGSGIPKNELPHVFDRFYRVEKSRSKEHGGSGLGLSIAKSMVEWHGGTIGVESVPGKGSTFWFTIPVF